MHDLVCRQTVTSCWDKAKREGVLTCCGPFRNPSQLEHEGHLPLHLHPICVTYALQMALKTQQGHPTDHSYLQTASIQDQKSSPASSIVLNRATYRSMLLLVSADANHTGVCNDLPIEEAT